MNSYSDPEITLNVFSQTITARRRLKNVWSMESAQDLKSVHNISAASELSAIMAKEICEEIDKEILRDLRSMAEEENPYYQLGDAVKEEIEENLAIAEDVHNQTPRQQKFRSIDD